jgi:Flp pilus assembly protein TadG
MHLECPNAQSSVLLQRLLSDRTGGVAVMTALALTSLLGFAGLGTEATLWYAAKRNMQGAADTAAFTAATAEVEGQNATSFTAAARAIAAQYGLANGINNVTVTVNNPPTSGGYTTHASAVEVIITQPQTMMFAGLFLNSSPTILARAVALPGSAGNGCVTALDKGDVTDDVDTGNSILSMASCSLYINSPSSSALQIKGGAQITAKSAYIVGNYTIDSNSTFTTSNGVTTGAAAATDPYAGASIPAFSGCNQTSYSQGNQTKTLGPATAGGTYVFCNGLTLNSGAALHLQPGVYIVDRGNLSVSGQATLDCPSCVAGTSGVTIVVTSSTGSNYGQVGINGGATVSLNAPPSGSTAGLVFFQDRNAPTAAGSNLNCGQANCINGGSTQNLQGAIYFPNQQVQYSGGSNSGQSNPCTQLIAYQLKFTGTSTFNNNCAGYGTQNIGQTPTTLVE